MHSTQTEIAARTLKQDISASKASKPQTVHQPRALLPNHAYILHNVNTNDDGAHTKGGGMHKRAGNGTIRLPRAT